MAESAIYKEFLLSKQRWHNRKRSNLFSKGCKISELHFVKIWQSDCSFLLYYCSSPLSVVAWCPSFIQGKPLLLSLNSTAGMSSHFMRWNSFQIKDRLNQSNLGSLQKVTEGTEAPFAIIHLILEFCPRVRMMNSVWKVSWWATVRHSWAWALKQFSKLVCSLQDGKIPQEELSNWSNALFTTCPYSIVLKWTKVT